MAEGGSDFGNHSVTFEDCEENDDQTLTVCNVHGDSESLASLYCYEPKCQRAICPKSVEDHTGHNIVDTVEDKKAKCKELFTDVQAITSELHMSKAKIVASKVDIENQFAASVLQLKTEKVEIIRTLSRKFNKMLKIASTGKRKVDKILHDDVTDIDNVLLLLESVTENTDERKTSYEDIIRKYQAVKTIASYVRQTFTGVRSYQYLDYTGGHFTREDVERLCGHLSRSEILIELPFIEDVKKEEIPEVKDEIKHVEVAPKSKPSPRRRKSSGRHKAPTFDYKVE